MAVDGGIGVAEVDRKIIPIEPEQPVVEPGFVIVGGDIILQLPLADMMQCPCAMRHHSDLFQCDMIAQSFDRLAASFACAYARRRLDSTSAQSAAGSTERRLVIRSTASAACTRLRADSHISAGARLNSAACSAATHSISGRLSASVVSASSRWITQ